MKITEYTILKLSEDPVSGYDIKLGDDLFYAGYDSDKGILTTRNRGFSLRIANEKFAIEHVGFLQNFFDTDGKIRQENIGKVIPPLVGVSEAAEMLGWKKQQISVYMDRGKFPEPIQRLASGPVWTYKQIEDYRDSRK